MYYIESIPKLRLFHGTIAKHDTIDLSCAKPLKDFGRGYYLTTYFSQAQTWAKRLECSPCYVYEYALTPLLEGIKILELLEYNEAWLNYISNNRSTAESYADYDIVYNKMDRSVNLFV